MGVNFTSGNHLVSTTNALDYNANYTIMGWFRYSSSPASASAIAVINNSAGTLYDLAMVNNNELYINVNGTFSLGSTLSANTWYHFAMVRSSTTLVTLYLDGVSDSAQATSVSGRAASTEENIGGVLSTFPFLGDIAYVKSWSTNLTVAEINQEMNLIRPVRTANKHRFSPLHRTTAERLRDYSGNGYNWTENGTVTDADAPPVSYGSETNIVQFAAAAPPTGVIGVRYYQTLMTGQ